MRNTTKRGGATIVLAAALCLVAAGCDMKRLVIRSSYLMVSEAEAAFFEEPDTILAAEAAPANLKLIEGMARGVPDDPELQIAAARMLSLYAFGFLEDCCEGADEQERGDDRARAIHKRALAYATRALDREIDFSGLMKRDLETFEAGLDKLGEEQVPALFWATFAWGLYINLSRADVAAVADLPKVAALSRRIAKLDETYFFGGAHLFLMVYYGSLGPAVGGDPVKSKAAYEKAWEIGGEAFLMTKYLFAKYYCQQTLDRDLFEKLLHEIIDAPDDLLPEQRLSNALSKQKAARLLARADDLF
jgi:hypothetical protein